MKQLAWFLFLVWSVLLAVDAQTPELPAGGRSLLPENPFDRAGIFWAGNLNDRPLARLERKEVEHPDFTKVLQVEILQSGGRFSNGGLNFLTTAAVEKGDVLLVRFYMRSVENQDESALSRTTVFVQDPGPGYEKYLFRQVSAGRDWVRYDIPVSVTKDRKPGELGFHIGLGGSDRPHIWQLGGLQFLNYGKQVAMEELPHTRATYEGREPDAPWRAEAAARIEKHRKGDFRIELRDSDGEPVQGAEVTVEMQRHAYHFGSVITAHMLTGEGEDHDRYRQAVLEMFNQSGTENDLKWDPWLGAWGPRFAQEQTLKALRWLKANNFYVRGHVLVWPGRKNIPAALAAKIPETDPTQADPAVKQAVLAHMDDILGKTGELLDEWDVLNEPFTNHLLMDAFGDHIMVDWFVAARKRLPSQALYLNDFGILNGMGREFPHQQHFEDTLRYLIEAGAPVTGMGMQGHFGEDPTSVPRVYAILERYHQAFPDLDIRVTEFDIQTKDRELQADYTRDFLTILFSHPATVGVQCWGFWAGAHWRPDAAMYTRNWELKPNGRVWKELTREQWWTRLNGQTDAQGVYTGRGFYGSYVVTVRKEGEEKEFEFTLLEDGQILQVDW